MWLRVLTSSVDEQPPDLTGSPGLHPGQQRQGVGWDGPGESVGLVVEVQTSHPRYLVPVYQGGQTGVV